MGDINASVVYSRPTEIWREQGLGSKNPSANANMKVIGTRLRKETTAADLTDISAKGKYMWEPTRYAEVNNKLDTVMVSNRLTNQQKAQVTEIFKPTVEPENFKISDHQMITISIEANCTMQINLYT